MPSLIQLSDLHFGPHHNSHLDEIILRDLAALHPDAVIVSGDFTMRARESEFAQAHDFLRQIQQPWLAIPGNHDQPILPGIDAFLRFTNRFARYRRYIYAATDTALQIDGLVALGLNDNHPIVPGGFWSGKQRQWIENEFVRAPQTAFKIIVTHHQLAWENKLRPAGFWRAEQALDFLAHNGVELVLNGHTHIANAEQSPQGIVIARAGTATSRRIRYGNANAYNLIRIDDTHISVEVRVFDESADAFEVAREFKFARHANRRGEI